MLLPGDREAMGDTFVNNTDVHVNGVPSDPMAARKAAVAINNELEKLYQSTGRGSSIR